MKKFQGRPKCHILATFQKSYLRGDLIIRGHGEKFHLFFRTSYIHIDVRKQVWSKTLVTVGQNQLLQKLRKSYILILGMKPKNQVIWTTRCRVMAKYTSIHFDIFRQKLVYYKVHQKQKLFRDGRISIGLLVAFVLTRSHLRNPLKKCSFQKM